MITSIVSVWVIATFSDIFNCLWINLGINRFRKHREKVKYVKYRNT